MGIYKKGALSGFSGTVGPVIGGRWRGIEYLRSKPVRSKESYNHPKLIEQRVKFTLTAKFLQAFRGLVKIGYPDTAEGITSRNRVQSHLLKEAITGIYPNFQLDFGKIVLTKGPVASPMNAVVSSPVPGTIDYNWVNDEGIGNAKVNDRTVVAVYCPELKRGLYVIHGNYRYEQSTSLNAPIFKGKQVHTWLAFITEDNIASDSVYTGLLTVAADSRQPTANS